MGQVAFASAASTREPAGREWVTSMATGYSGLPNELVSAANGVGYAYRDTGGS